jgi:hypothetical protein
MAGKSSKSKKPTHEAFVVIGEGDSGLPDKTWGRLAA